MRKTLSKTPATSHCQEFSSVSLAQHPSCSIWSFFLTHFLSTAGDLNSFCFSSLPKISPCEVLSFYNCAYLSPPGFSSSSLCLSSFQNQINYTR